MWQWIKRIERLVTGFGTAVQLFDVFIVFLAILLTAIWIQRVINL